MIILAQAVLFLWLPIIVLIFVNQTPKKAVVFAFVIGWLALPSRLYFSLPGLPDYTKMSATVVGVLIAAVVFDLRRLMALRPKWYDVPMVVWCLCPFASAISNEQGSYEGFSSTLEQIVMWGLPYLIGRTYLGDIEGMRLLGLGIAVGGLAYMLPCLVEVRMSPQIERWIYGITHWEDTRYGGYRPKVLLSSGLELGMWMTNSSMLCYQLWACGTVKRLWSYSFGTLTAALVVTTVLCKSTGAIALLLAGVGVLWATRKFKVPWLIWALVAVAPVYSTTRAFNIWSGKEAVDLSSMLAGEDRAGSLKYRMDNEDVLAHHALERPYFGWGRFGRSFVVVNGRTAIVDGYWMVSLGIFGLVGLTSMELIMLLPMVLTLRRFPVKTWSDPRVGPVVGLSIMLVLMMVDFLSNGMMNPIYPLTIGGLIGLSPSKGAGASREAEAALGQGADLAAGGRSPEAELEFRRAIELASADDDESRRVQAEALDGLGHSLLATGRPDEAIPALHDALAVRDALAEADPKPGRFRDLAIAREGLARALAEAGRSAEAIEERRIALQVWDALASEHPADPDYRDRRVDALNDLAWLLATDPDPRLREPTRAVELAEEAALGSADHAASWNTLGVARYRAGDWAGAIEALERSAAVGPDRGGTAFDHFFLAMAYHQALDDARAIEWYERGVAWAARYRPGHPDLARFRDEAEALLGSAGRARVDVT